MNRLRGWLQHWFYTGLECRRANERIPLRSHPLADLIEEREADEVEE